MVVTELVSAEVSEDNAEVSVEVSVEASEAADILEREPLINVTLHFALHALDHGVEENKPIF